MPHARQQMLAREVDGIVRIRSDFSRQLMLGNADVQVLVRGTDANTARIIQGYAQGAVAQWAARQSAEGVQIATVPVVVQDRLWFNAANDSRYFLVPGLIVLIMTLIGALLTALVMAREWERGTLEALFVTPVEVGEILLGKTIPYFVLGMIGLALCVVAAEFLFHVPLRGSILVLTGVSMLYLLAALGIGLLISSVTRNQFVASQVTLLATFLPALMLSGFLFDLRSHAGGGAGDHLRDAGPLFRRLAANAVSRRQCLVGHPAQHVGAGRHGDRLVAADAPHDAQETGLRPTMIDSIFRILALIRKELLAVLKDPRCAIHDSRAADDAMPDLRLCGELRFERRALCRVEPGRRLALLRRFGAARRHGRVSPRRRSASRGRHRHDDRRPARARGHPIPARLRAPRFSRPSRPTCK